MHGEGEIVVVVALLRPGSIRGKIEKKKAKNYSSRASNCYRWRGTNRVVERVCVFLGGRMSGSLNIFDN